MMQQRAPTPPPVVIDCAGYEAGLLTRAIVHEAMVLAAVDGVGANVWDPIVDGDAATALKAGAIPFRVQIAPVDSTLRINLERIGTPTVSVGSWSVPLTWRGSNVLDYLALSTDVSVLARGAWIAALQTSGCRRVRNTARSRSPVGDVTPQQDSFCFVDQWRIVGDVHEDLRHDGASPTRLIALVRGYANLGLLTRRHWNASSQAYSARALLYAAQLMELAQASPQAHAARAYAATLAGLNAQALEDLSASATESVEEPDRSIAEVLQAACHGDAFGLQTLWETNKALPLAAVLASAVTVEEVKSQGALFTEKAVDAHPDCLLLYDLWSSCFGVSVGHQATTLGPRALRDVIAHRVTPLPDLPAAARASLPTNNAHGLEDRFACDAAESFKDLQKTSQLVAALRAAATNDLREPSWAALGTLIEDTAFLQAWRRATFMKNVWNVPVEDFLEQALPALSDHAMRPYIESFRHQADRKPRDYQAVLMPMRIGDARLCMRPLFVDTWSISQDGSPMGSSAHARAMAGLDATAWDLQEALSLRQGGGVSCGVLTVAATRDLARRLLMVSPFSTEAYQVAVELDWDRVTDEVDHWPPEVLDRPSLAAAMGLQYRHERLFEKAEASMRQAVAGSPDMHHHFMLAGLYERQGKTNEYLATLHAYLEQPDPRGLEHARVQQALANYHMLRGEWDQARPYAREAAQTGANWGMLCLARCCEGLQQWDEAENWVRRAAERYDKRSQAWYLWCKRTGCGDLAAARDHAFSHLGAMVAGESESERGDAIICYLLDDQQAPAFEIANADFEKLGNPFLGLQAAMAAFALGNLDERDRLLVAAAVRDSAFLSQYPAWLVYADLADWMRAYLLGPREVATPERIEQIVADTIEMRAINIFWFAGRMHELLGETEAARTYHRCALQTAELYNQGNYVLAAADLRRLGGEARNYWMEAATRRIRGDSSAYVDVLKAYLAFPDPGPVRRRFQDALGEEYIRQKRWAEAVPCLESAAAAADWWSMVRLMRCEEQLEHWERAEELARRIAATGSHDPLAWYTWCVRTGRGDISAAETEATHRIAKLSLDNAAGLPTAEAAQWALLAGRQTEALELLDRRIADKPTPNEVLHAALLLMDLGRPADMQRYLALLDVGVPEAEHWNKLEVAIAKVARLFIRSEGGTLRPSQPDDVQRMIDWLPERDQPAASYFMGRFREFRGEQEEAAACYQRGLDSEGFYLPNAALAAVRKRCLADPAAAVPR